MFIYLSYLLYAWLIVGLLVGIKAVFVEEVLGKDTKEAIRLKHEGTQKYEDIKPFLKKRNFIIFSTLFGFLSLVAYIKVKIEIFQEKKKLIDKDKK